RVCACEVISKCTRIDEIGAGRLRANRDRELRVNLEACIVIGCDEVAGKIAQCNKWVFERTATRVRTQLVDDIAVPRDQSNPKPVVVADGFEIARGLAVYRRKPSRVNVPGKVVLHGCLPT